MSKTFKRKKLLVYSILIGLTYFLFGLGTINDYGINWDEPSHYLRGQAYLRFFLTGKKNYDGLPKLKSHYVKNEFYDIPKEATLENDKTFRKSLYQYDREGEKFTYQYYLKHDSGHPPLNGILASLSNYIFYQKLGILGDIEAYHLFTIFISSILVGSVFLFTSSIYGAFAGIISVLSLSFYPLFFAESHFNVKDPVQTAFYSLTIFTFVASIINNKWKLIIVSSLFAGFSLGTKFNIFFAIIPLSIWLLFNYLSELKSFRWPFSRKITISFFVYPLISFGILFATWPYLWQNPIGNFLKTIDYYKVVGLESYQLRETFLFGILNTYAIQWIIFSTPVVILGLSLLGIVYSVRYGFFEKNKISILILLWFLTPIIRVSFPSSGIYGGVRQIMEYIPAMAILSGIGGWYLAEKLKKITNLSLFFMRVFILLLFTPVILILVSLHPNQNVYFNSIIGGFRGAKERNFPDWGVTLGSVYKQGVDYLNENAQKDGKLTLVRGLLSNVPQITLRRDINFSDKYYSGNKMNGEYIMEVIDYWWDIYIPEDRRNYLESLDPVYQVVVDDVAILSIWKNDEEYLKSEKK